MFNFLPSFHFEANKLTPEWAKLANDYCWNSNNKSLLDGKNPTEIEQYVAGEFDLDEFKKMYKSQRKELQNKSNPNFVNSNSRGVDIDWICLSLIADKYNAATTLISKIPIEVFIKAIDPLATQKKQEDINFLKNKPKIEQDLQDVSDKLGLGKVDLGSTQHSSIPFSDNPYGLDLAEPDELDVFVNLLYALKVEAAFETILDIFWKLKRGNQVHLLRIRDQLKFGVSCDLTFESSITGLSDLKYVYPGNMFTPPSDLPDYSDNTHRFLLENPTITELYNFVGAEICDENKLELIINGTDKSNLGYCSCNGLDRIHKDDFGSARVKLLFGMVQSIDGIGITGNPKSKKGFKYFTSDHEEIKKCTKKVIANNTYCYWWLENTSHFFGIHKSGFATRTKGMESHQSFPCSIYKSQEKSAVELSIKENKLAQEAYIKMQHTIRMSLPPGKKIDLRFMRNALSGLKDKTDEWTMNDLINLIFENNLMIGDTEGFEGKNDGQFKAFETIPGGLPINEIAGYAQVIANCNQNISRYMGTNGQITGQAYEELVANNKLAINASMNAIEYVSQAAQFQTQNTYNIWSYQVKDAVERGGAEKKAITDMIGSEKVNLIDAIDDFSSHQMSVEVKIASREEERVNLQRVEYNLKAQKVLSEADSYMLSAVSNPKDKWKLIAIKQKQFEKKEAKRLEQQYAQQQQLMQQQGQNLVASKAAEAQGEKELVFAKGQVEANIVTLANQLGMNAMQLKAAIDRQLQDNRNTGQTDKKIKELQTKSNLEQQQPFS